MNGYYEDLIPLGAVRLADAPATGNKAAVLGELAHLGETVPDGYCLTARPFHELLTTLLKSRAINRSSWRSLAEAIADTNLPADLSRALSRSLPKIHPVSPNFIAYGVRSSASIEDRPDFSFAGQFHTEIGVSTSVAVEAAIRRCWASLFTGQVIAYAEQSGLDLAGASMAVLIQALVPADKSGVLFTRDPVRGDNVFIIEATWGFGSPLVGGEITPDTVRLEASGKLLDYSIGSKKEALVLVNQQLRKVRLNPAKRSARCLSERDLRLLADMGDRIDKILHPGQDIEFAFVGDSLWVLQARPITTLQQVSHANQKDLDDYAIY